jgi:cell division topological specificity factor
VGIFSYFRQKKPNSASVAKERLQIIVAHERRKRDQPDFLADMQKEILDVIKKYVSIENDDISMSIDSQSDCSVLELNITLPDK